MTATVREEVLVLLLTDIYASAAAANQHAGIGLSCAKARVAPRLARGDDAEQRCPRIALRIRVPSLIIVTVDRRCIVYRHRRHPRGHAARRGGDIELCDCPGSADAAVHVIPVALASHAERRDNADAGNDDTGLPAGRHAVTII